MKTANDTQRKTLSNVKSDQLEVPDETWDADRLGEFAHGEEKTIRLWDKRLAVHVHRLGHALCIAKKKVEEGKWKSSKKWGDFLKRYKISTTSDWRARGLFDATGGDEKKVAGLGITKAYRKYDLLAPPKTETPNPVASQKTKGNKKDETPPPPKEDTTTLTSFVAQVVLRPEYFVDEAAFLDKKKESPEHCCQLIEQAIAILAKVKEMLSHVA